MTSASIFLPKVSLKNCFRAETISAANDIMCGIKKGSEN